MGIEPLPDRLGARLRRRPATRARSSARTASKRDRDPARGAGRGRLSRRRRPRGLRAGRLRPLHPQRLQGPDRALLGDGDERADQGDDRSTAPPRPRSPRSPARRAWSRLREDGLQKVRAGVTTIDEVARVSCSVMRRSSFDPGDDDQPTMSIDFADRAQPDGRAERPPTSTSRPASRRRSACAGRSCRWRTYPKLTQQDTREIVYSVLNDAQRKRFENEQPARPRLLDPGPRPLPRQRLLPARRDQRRLPPDPARDPDARDARAAGRHGRVHAQAARLHPRHRPDRLGQVDDAGLDGRHDQHASARSTSSRSRTRSSSCTATRTASSTSARSGPTRPTSPRRCEAALREDPDVILVGEMRDLETISTALTAAETGHLVFATLHTQSTAQTVDRIIDVFPPHQQHQVRMQLSIALQGIVTQQLLPTADGLGPRLRDRDPDPDAGDPQPDPRGQDPPDLLGAADLGLGRDADDGREPGRAGARRGDLAAARRAAGRRARGASSPARHRRHGRQRRCDPEPMPAAMS